MKVISLEITKRELPPIPEEPEIVKPTKEKVICITCKFHI